LGSYSQKHSDTKEQSEYGEADTSLPDELSSSNKSHYSLRSKSTSKSDPKISQDIEVQQDKSKESLLDLSIKSDKTKKRCGNYRMKTPSPGCNGVDGCKWIPKVGCLENKEEVIKKEIEMKTMKDPSTFKHKKKKNNCKTFKKNKDPKCKEQEDCKWIEKQGKKPGHCSPIN